MTNGKIEKLNMKSFYWRMVLAISATLMLLAIAYILVSVRASKNYFMETTQKLNAKVAEYLVEEVNPFEDGKVNEASLSIIMHSMMAVNPGIEVFLLSPDGDILSFVVLKSKILLKSVELEPINKFIDSKGETLVLGDDPRSPGTKTIFSATKVIENGQIKGYVYITLGSEKFQKISGALLGKYWLNLTGWPFLITLLVSLIIAMIVSGLLTKNIREIVNTVQRFKDGDLEARVPPINTQSEIKGLADTFNQMADNMVSNIEKLKNVDLLRRELIANVSHDLRNPIAIVNGYIETLIIRGDQVTPEEQKKYLAIINESVDKLAKLVSDLFDLSKLETGQMPIKIEPFKIQELLNDASIKYKVLAESKKISLIAEISPTIPVVQADLYLMDRVIQNLIDNAVKYSPENGSILLTGYFCQERKKVCVSVKNSGNGIPQDSLDSIFDRYYKVDKEKNRIEGAGLGLAIVRKILEAHHTTIVVHSDSKSFTEFVFELEPNPYFSMN